jgi:hypothetical protein
MERRGFLKFLGLAAAVPVAAHIPAVPESKPVRAHKPIPESAWETERNIRAEMNGATISLAFLPGARPFSPATSIISYSEYADAGRMPTYEGVVYGGDGTRLWRFDVVSGSNFKCRNCDLILPFSREDFRQHGQSCNHKLEEYKS